MARRARRGDELETVPSAPRAPSALTSPPAAEDLPGPVRLVTRGPLARRQALPLLAISVPVFQLATLLAFIWTQTPRVPWGDEWALIPLLQKADAGSLSFADLWTLHNRSHRIVLPRGVDLLLIDTTHWNRQVMMTFDLGVALATGVLLLLCVRATLQNRQATFLLLAPLSLLYFSFAQYENWILPWQLTFIATVLGVACCMYGFTHREEARRAGERSVSWQAFMLALLGAIVASLSSFSGLFAWVAFLPSAARSGRVRLALWIASALAIGIPYLIGFSSDGSNSLLHEAAFFLAALGAPVAALNLTIARLFGAIGLAGMGLALYAYVRLRLELARIEPWIELAAFSALATVATTLGRAVFGNGLALISRYQEFSALWWIALAVIGTQVIRHLAVQLREHREIDFLPDRRHVRSAVIGGVVLLVLCMAASLASGFAGVHTAREFLAPMRANQSCIAQTQSPTDACLEPYFLDGFIPMSNQQLVAYIRDHHLAIFDQ